VTLASIDSAALARSITDRVSLHIAGLAFRLQPGVVVRIDTHDADSTDLGWSVAHLVEWARTGQGGDWGPIGSPDAATCARDALGALTSVLYRRPADDPDTLSLPALDAASDAGGDIETLVRAAWARSAIDLGEPVPRRCLASLAGITDRAIQQAIERKDLAAMRARKTDRGGKAPRHIAPDEARRYLAARVVGAETAAALGRAGAKPVFQVEPGGARLWIPGDGMAVATIATVEQWRAIERRGKVLAWVAGS
jgi:hypothetical protein